MVRSVDFILDIDECTGDTHNCSRNNSTSTNTEGSFNCSCKQGFTGNGHKCEGRILEKLYYPTIYSMRETSKSCVNFHRLASLLVSTADSYTLIFSSQDQVKFLGFLQEPLFCIRGKLRVNKNRLSENAFTIIFKNEHCTESNNMCCTVRGLRSKKFTRPSITVHTSKLNDFVWIKSSIPIYLSPKF